MTKAEEIRYKNLLSKYEKAMAKLDTVEQENDELRKQNNDASKNYDKLLKEIVKINQEVVDLKDKKKEANAQIKKLQARVKELEQVVLDFKCKLNKDSSNSSKPSSANGFKKVVQNNREKSNRPKGGQLGRKGKTLEKIVNPDKIIEVFPPDICECGGQIIRQCEYIAKQVIDIISKIETLEYRYYDGVCSKCGKVYHANIPQKHANPVNYSEHLKTLVLLVKNISNMSIKTTQAVFKSIYPRLNISDGWIHKLDENFAKKAKPVIDNIRECIINSDVIFSDETGAKINNKLGCCIACSNSRAVIYDIFGDKSKKSFDEFNVFNTYKGILMHDHNKTYYKYFGISHAECNVHVCRYLKGVIDIFKREGAKKFREFLLQIYEEKLDALTDNKQEFSEQRINEIENEYIRLLKNWKNEFNEYTSNIKTLSRSLRDERNLFTRLIEYKEEHLRFVKDFRVPFSNNEAERNLRKIKLKLNVSKLFGNITTAKNYAIIKSIIETAKKQGKDIFETIIKISNGNCAVFDLN